MNLFYLSLTSASLDGFSRQGKSAVVQIDAEVSKSGTFVFDLMCKSDL